MAISIDWGTKVITVPQADLSALGGDLYELDTDWFRLQLKALEDDEEGMPYLDTHQHNTELVLGGVTYARTIEIINGYTVTFEDGQYAVTLTGSNNNIADVVNLNNVSVRTNNAAGLVALNAIQASLETMVTDIWGHAVESTYSAQEILRLLVAVLAGKTAGAEGKTIRFRDLADTKDRIVATVDPKGNRTSVARDET